MSELKLFPAWKEAVKTLIEGGLTYGSTVTKDQIIDLCGMEKPKTIEQKDAFDLRLMGVICNIKDALLTDHKMLLSTNYDGSYRVIAPKDQTAHTIENFTRTVSKEFQRAALSIQYVNHALLDETQRKQNADAQAKLSMLAGMQRIARGELSQIVGAA